jgi:RNA polymerase sigma-70 factor (ECF subfamily)
MPPTNSGSQPEAPRGDGDAFRHQVEPFRRELRLHCYRMLGSSHDAEDAVQETLLRAWRSLEEFEGRASLRNWLYKIATNTCLNAIAARKSMARLLPQDLSTAAQAFPKDPATEIAWLEPHPDDPGDDLNAMTPGPEARYEQHEAVRLAFVAALQYLPPRQRAVLLLRDVLGWSASEAAQLLDTSIASITSALQRARDTLSTRYDSTTQLTATPDERQRALLDRYVAAWEAAELDAFVSLLTEDAILSMPPYREWYRGRDAIRGFFAWAWNRYDVEHGAFRLVPTAANRQPAFALYSRRRDEGDYLAHSLQVLTLRGDHIAVLTNFKDPRLFEHFGLPEALR